MGGWHGLTSGVCCGARRPDGLLGVGGPGGPAARSRCTSGIHDRRHRSICYNFLTGDGSANCFAS
eukprot:scaffold93612_cov46-Prasinocladus_malaysianus.AAC.1